MALLGEFVHRGGVGSISCAGVVEPQASRPTMFATGGSTDGCVKLWDMRLPRKKDFITVHHASLADLLELRFHPSGLSAVAACGDALVSVDFRKPSDIVSKLSLGLSSDVAYLSSFWLPDGGSSSSPFAVAAAVDDDGRILPVRMSTSTCDLRIAEEQEWGACAFHVSAGAAGSSPCESFGSMPNICCGVAKTISGSGAVTMWLVAMDGALHGYQWSKNSSACSMVVEANVSAGEDSLAVKSSRSRQVCNPPLPTCMSAAGAFIAIGRGDGQYIISETSTDADTGVASVETALVAPAHECNGLVAAQWVNPAAAQHLVTVALSGEVTMWNVAPFLTPAAEDDEGTGDLPPVVFAAAARDVPSRTTTSGVVNCCDISSHSSSGAEPSMLIGDSEGSVFLFELFTA